ncbi:MAG: SDR family oxidoreductase [Microlunatus sp.]|nr:SDR family oxidoreductase [Microlunatus sp.]MDN5769505.1 SDR family oxidoreductase [Microlunatus sp.]
MDRLAGKVAVVTGASRGLGEAIATGFAREGASVVLAARTVADLDRVAARCRDAGTAQVEVMTTDVTDEDQLTALVDTTIARLGHLDVFVANAGIAVPSVTDRRMTTLETYELDVVERLFAVNTVGMWLSMKAALPVMPVGGSFIAIGSELGRMAGAGAGVYAVTKAGVDLLVRIAAAESAARRVRVNCLSPGGMVDTHLFGPNKMPDYIKAHVPWSAPEVIVPAAIWLASDESESVTGKRLAGTEFNQTPLEDLRAGLEDA